jgi:tetratricopeptide (TPR) repeat protein
VLDSYFKIIKSKDIIADDYEMYAKTIEKLGDDSTAIVYYYKAIEKDSTKSPLLSDIAQNYTRQKKYDQSVEVYKKIVATNPSFKNYYDLGKAYYSLKDYENARAMFDQMKVSEPEVYLGYFWAGNAWAQTEDMENPEGKAKADYEKTIELISASGKTDRYKKDFIASNSYLAYLYYSKEDFENAYKHCEAVLSLEAEHPQCKPLMEFLAKNKKP